ncbi:hypothetical protein EGK14_16445 [Erwinia sp. 198]|nr:hypothetical protein EGK14_16445 [Erwinia sp. 198]
MVKGVIRIIISKENSLEILKNDKKYPNKAHNNMAITSRKKNIFLFLYFNTIAFGFWGKIFIRHLLRLLT